MNLLQNRINVVQNCLTTDNFREEQYNLIPYFCNLFIEYLNQQTPVPYLEKIQNEIEKKINYYGIFNSQVKEINIMVKDASDKGVEKEFVKVFIPELIDGTFFFINGNYYVPSLYAIDLPIIVKKQSLKISGLFNSITFHTKDDIVIFTGRNIPTSYFIKLFLYDEEGKELCERFKETHNKINLIEHSEENIISYFSNSFKKFNSREEVIHFLENIFLDDYTRDLYASCYPEIETINMSSIIKEAIKRDINRQIPSFIDLTKKRLVFIELILKPIIERVSKIVMNVTKGFNIDTINMNSLSLIKYFLTSPDTENSGSKNKKGLGGNFIYNNANLYTGILKNKMSMVPIGIENAPKEIQSIDKSHYQKICPISISSQKPGHVVSLIPGTKLDKFGRFLYEESSISL